ncbi:MAG: hypothetical protein AAF657_04955 [Acidobacteriota bacterium]
MRSRTSRAIRSEVGLVLTALLLTFATATAAFGREYVDRRTRAEVPVPKDFSVDLLKETVTDPQGDTLNSGVIDIQDFSVDAIDGNLVIELTFYGAISPPDSGEANALDGYVDLDTDQIASPDDELPWTDELLGLNATGMGNEYYVEFFTYSSVDGLVDVIDDSDDSLAGRVAMTVTANSVMVTIPLSVLGDDDGAVNAAAIVFPEFEDPTDKVPNNGNVSSVPGTGSPNTVFLQGNRFTVDVEWTDPLNVSGPGKLITQSDDSAVLYFFSNDNWEMLIKVLDGCAINNHYWVFFAATTDVGFTVTVTDTANDLTETYTNELGQPADAVTDTGAFATCP